MRKAKTGDVLMSAGLESNFLDAMEHLHNKPFPSDQFGELHTFAIFITQQRKRSGLWDEYYYLIWKPFIGFRWIQITDGTGKPLPEKYSRIENAWDHSRVEIVNLDLQCAVLEVEQKHFNKWRGNDLTKRLIEHLSEPERTELFQQHIREISENLKAGKCKPKDSKKVVPRLYDKPQD